MPVPTRSQQAALALLLGRPQVGTASFLAAAEQGHGRVVGPQHGGLQQQLFLPLILQAPNEPPSRVSHNYGVYARLKPDVTMAQALAETGTVPATITLPLWRRISPRVRATARLVRAFSLL